MASNSLNVQTLLADRPYMKLAPSTGHYQLRRKFEDSSTGAQALSAVQGYQRMYYSYQLIRNRLRGIYPTGGRMGMCISLESTRTARYSPYNSNSWPNAYEPTPLWSAPTLCFSHFTNYTLAFNAGFGDFTVVGLGMMVWNVGMSNINVANDATPPAGFSSDLRGICTFIRNTEYAAITVDMNLESYNPKSAITDIFGQYTTQEVLLNNRYDLSEITIDPPLVYGVKDSALSILPEVRPSGLFWPQKGESPGSGDTFNTSRILPEVETWREMNLFPVSSDGTMIANFPMDYSLALNHPEFKGNSILFRKGQTLKEFPGYVYWVTREGPMDFKKTEKLKDQTGNTKTKITIDRKVFVLLFEASLTGMQDNTKSRYRTTIEYLVGSNSIAPRYILKPPEKLLQPPLLPLGGSYNSVFTNLHMDSPGAPATGDEKYSKLSEIAHHYKLDGRIFCGNVIVDDQMFKRINISGYVHTQLWAEAGSLLYLHHSDWMLPGMATTLMTLMITVGALGLTMAPQYSNDSLSLYLGGFTHSLCHNNTIPEIGVTIGSHRTNHTIYLASSGYTYDPDEEKQKEEEKGKTAPPDANAGLSDFKPIYQYNGWGASPHRISMGAQGLLLIPTDIGILQYNSITNKVICEWLNPTLLSFVSDKLYIEEKNVDSIITCTIKELTPISTDANSSKYLAIDLASSLLKNKETYLTSSSTILRVRASEVYNRTAHMGSYGQVCYESGDFTADLIVLLDRT